MNRVAVILIALMTCPHPSSAADELVRRMENLDVVGHLPPFEERFCNWTNLRKTVYYTYTGRIPFPRLEATR